MADRKFVRIEHDGPLATLTIDRPDRLNALDAQVLEELSSGLDELIETGEARCLILTGSGKAFVAGADIEAMKDLTAEQARSFSDKGHAILAKLETLPFPVIAAVNGFALGGGCELALACDFVYASERAKLGQPEVKLGVIPGFGGTQRLARRVGVGLARELVYTGKMINAEEALRIGLVNAVFPSETLLAEVRKTAMQIASMGPLAVRAAKQVILQGEGMGLPEANALEAEAFGGCFASEDQTEGMDAFLGKREPKFSGR